MRMCRHALMTAAVMLLAVPLQPVDAGAQTAPGDAGTRMGPSRSRDVVIEEPRPPAPAVETEGRGDRHNCQSEPITEWQDPAQEGMKLTPTQRQCDR
jgi:hypothetical protein